MSIKITINCFNEIPFYFPLLKLFLDLIIFETNDFYFSYLHT